MVPDQRVFPTVEAMQKAMERLRNAPPDGVTVPEGFDRITPKTMRKWFSSVVASADPEQALQRLLGHSPGSRVTRKHYIRSTPVQLRQAVQRLGLQ
jgi:integrase